MKFKIITLGCKVNTYESNFIEESLLKKGFSFCNDETLCDIIIINTCTVTDTSDKKSLKMVRHIKKVNPNAILVICGCSVQNNPSLYENLANITIGNKQKSKVSELIIDYLESQKNYFFVNKDRKIPFEDMMITNFDQVRCYIKIQDGCDNFCSYCIIPYVRGSVRCKKFNKVIEEVNLLAQKGFKEVVLTGIHTGMYNDEGKDLTDLINAISKIEGIKRIMLSSVEITELNEKFLNMLKTNSKFCHHLHVPLQAGSDEILKKMNRKYDLEYFKNKIREIRNILPDIAITTDVIVGHNYETEELFLNTLAFCEEINFAKIHVFPYSKRTGTSTSYMPNEVSETDKKARVKRLISLSEKLEKAYYDKFKNREVEVLIEQVKDGQSYGHTSNYLMVKLEEELKINEFYTRIL